MDIKEQKFPRKFQKKLVTAAVQSLLVGCLSVYSLSALASKTNEKWVHTSNYLDSGVWSKVVDANFCFNAAPKSLLEVEPIVVDGHRAYKVSQYFDSAVEKQLYAKPIEDQIKDHKIIGRKFCNGIVSISNMRLPFAKGEGINDANDGLLAVDAMRHGLADILDHISSMASLAVQAASGTYSSTDLYNLDVVFQQHLDEINSIADSTRFNNTKLLDGSVRVIKVPVDGGRRIVDLTLANMLTGSGGLNISGLSVSTTYSAQNSLSTVNQVTDISTQFGNIKKYEVALNAAVKRDEVTTYVDVTSDKFTVQHMPSTAAINE